MQARVYGTDIYVDLLDEDGYHLKKSLSLIKERWLGTITQSCEEKSFELMISCLEESL